ncbi:GMC oxidoreductase [Nemania sp. FL0916]|nr:GMC oxidoreductase [Nemania sp. FL0916]
MASGPAEYVVVGGGLAGCVIASRLSQQGKDVILLEAGPDPSNNPATATFLTGVSLAGGDLDYSYTTEPVLCTDKRTHRLIAGKALGGGTVLNYGGWLRGDAADYDEWAELVGDERWSYQGLKPWFVKSEKFHDPNADPQEHGFDGPVYVTSIAAAQDGQRKYPLRETVKKAWAELEVQHNVDRKNGASEGLNEMHENCDSEGKRQPSNVVYPLSKAKVLTNTLVHKVIFDGTGKAAGVLLVDGSVIIATKEVILSAGAHQTPKILMLSGIGPSPELANHGIPVVYESKHVGRNLHDHFALHLAWRLRDPSRGYALGSPGFSNPAFFKCFPWDWVANQTVPKGALPKMIDEEPKPGWEKRSAFEVLTAYIIPGIRGIPTDGSHISTSTMLLLPTSRGVITLRSSSPTDPPRIYPNYLTTQQDRETLIYATRRTLKAMLGTENLGAIVECESPPDKAPEKAYSSFTPLTLDSSHGDIDTRLRETGEPHQHSGGTAAMGKVVDGEGRVFGVTGLRVADASIIPVPLGGHPQASLYAMAEQIASMILADS